MKRQTIAQILAAGTYGGAESVVALLAGGLSERGHRVPVVLILDEKPNPHPFEEALRAEGREVHALRLAPRAYLEERRRLRLAIKALNPNLLHSHGYRADIQIGSACPRYAMPTMTTLHGFTGGNWRMRLYEALQIRALHRLSAISVVSNSIRDRLRRAGLPEDRIHLVRNAWKASGETVDRERARAELGLPPFAMVVGWVGRLSIEKGADVLIDALSMVSKRDVQVCIVGDGPETGPLRQRASRAGVADQIHWAGARPSAGRLFRAFDVFVLSSRTEGTPIVLFEAAAANVPIVATAVGGVPDVLREQDAVIVPPSRPDLLARAIEESLKDTPKRRARIAEARARLATQFALAPWLDLYEEIYSSLLS